MVTAAKLEYEKEFQQSDAEVAASSGTKTPDLAPKNLRIFPEMDLTVVIDDRRDSDSPKRIRITGKADWAYVDSSFHLQPLILCQEPRLLLFTIQSLRSGKCALQLPSSNS